ncbi:leucine-rich repeat protein SHOC-2-like [Oscarella lobularis]|uniref:leucine-rich repeat protein SHOC-2-like n=1 Tax=Oscarella lobularis TaxID=121494 RepID=UPI00331399DB
MGERTEWTFCAEDGQLETRKVEQVNDPSEMPDGERLDLTRLPLSDFDWSPVLQRTVNTLTVLNMGECDLVTIPSAIANLVNLQRLRVESNSLRSLPDEIAYLQSLTRLNAFGNKLSTLPGTLRFLSKLKILRLGGNAFADNSLTVVERISSLEELYLRENPNLRTITRGMARLPHLRVLNAEDNRIETPLMDFVNVGLPGILLYYQF